MRIRDAHDGRFPSEEIGNQYGQRVAKVTLTREEVYEALARAAVEKVSKTRACEESLPLFGITLAASVSVFPDELARFVVLGRGIVAELWDGYPEVVIRLLPDESSA